MHRFDVVTEQTLLSCTAGEVNDELTTIPVVPAEPETLKATVEVEVELSPMAVHEEVETNATISIDSGALTETPEPDSQDRNNDMALSLVYKWENPYLSTEESTKSSDHTGNFARVPNEGELVLSGIRSTPSTSNREGAVFDIYRDLATTTVTDSLSECFDFDTVMELLMSDDEGYEDLLPSVWANISRGAVTGPDHKLTRAATNSLTVCFDCETLPELVATDTGSMEDLLRSPWENISTATQGFLQSFFTQFATCATFPTEGQLVPIEAAVATAMERETRPDYPLSAESTAQKMETVSAATPHGPSEWVGMKSLFSQAFCPVPPGPRQCGVLEGLRASEDTAWNELPRDDAVHLPCDMDIPPSDAIIFDATDERQPSLVEDAETMQTVASLENVGASTESGAEEGLAPGWQLVLSVVFAVTLLLALRAYITWVTNCFVYSNVATSIGRKHSGRRGPRIPRPHIEPQAHPVSSSRKKKGKRGRRQQAAVSSILSSPPQPYNGAAVGAATAATTTPTTGNNHADNTAGSSSQPGS